MVKSVIRRLSWGVLVLLSACFGSSGSAPSTAPANFTVTPGDTNVVITWDPSAQPGATYYLYYKSGTEVAVREIDAAVLYNVTSPLLIGGLTNGQPYSFVMNYSTGGGPAGPSTGLVTISPRPVSTWTAGPALGAINLSSIAFEGSYLVTGGAGGALYVAPYSLANHGIPTWAPPTTPATPAVTSDISFVFFDGGRFWALCADGTLQYSTDGSAASWARPVGTYPISVSGLSLNSMAYGNGTFVIVGSQGTIFRSTNPNATTSAWTQSASGTTANLYTVRFLNGLFFVLGQNGTLMTSSDGITWSSHISGTTNGLRWLDYGALTNGYTYYVAVGDAGTVTVLNAATQNPGTQQTTWTVQPVSGVTDNLTSVTHGFDARFVAVGANGRTINSNTVVDGVWNSGSTGTGNLNSLVVTNAVWYAVGPSGTNVVGQ